MLTAFGTWVLVSWIILALIFVEPRLAKVAIWGPFWVLGVVVIHAIAGLVLGFDWLMARVVARSA